MNCKLYYFLLWSFSTALWIGVTHGLVGVSHGMDCDAAEMDARESLCDSKITKKDVRALESVNTKIDMFHLSMRSLAYV